MPATMEWRKYFRKTLYIEKRGLSVRLWTRQQFRPLEPEKELIFCPIDHVFAGIRTAFLLCYKVLKMALLVEEWRWLQRFVARTRILDNFDAPLSWVLFILTVIWSCPGVQCDGDFQCADGTCIPWSRTCDGTRSGCNDNTHQPTICGTYV